MKRVLITGASGFLGKYILNEFSSKGYEITTIGRTKVETSNLHISYNLTNSNIQIPDKYFEKVVHVAGKAHVFPKTEAEKQAFYDVNLQGTKNLLEAISKLTQKPKMFINISTVAVYGKLKGDLLSESDELAANTPYGISKLKAEKEVEKWANLNNCNYLNLRLPLIAGENPPGNLGDMKAAVLKGTYPRIKNNNARKSVVLATDVAQFIQAIWEKDGSYNLTDGYHPTFEDIENAIQKRLNKKIAITIPKAVIKFMAIGGDILEVLTKKSMPISSTRLSKLTTDLTFDDTKARKELGWQSNNSIEFIEKYL